MYEQVKKTVVNLVLVGEDQDDPMQRASLFGPWAFLQASPAE